MPLRRTHTFANLNILNDENQLQDNDPLWLSLPAADPPDAIIEKGHSPGIYDRRPFAVLAQPYTSMACPSTFKPAVTTTCLPRQSSPLGPCQSLLPGRPIFPPSVCKPDLYRQALKKSARQAKKHIRRMERKKLGGLHPLVWPTSPARKCTHLKFHHGIPWQYPSTT